ncbi:hypothetical protein CICLE_v10017985mg [Citrus x clementina]|uniref:Uncharacterized protein n=1 Tax=Citrus clementina TaxID=85681 RepID=V4W5P4_CITCL|nr:hypothetical protein CICLE_v10017985mg [Citrus x clementina]
MSCAKVCHVNSVTGVNEEKISELKSKIVLLKKAPNESDPGMVPCWGKGERVPFIILRLVSDMISTEKERIVINHTLCNMLRTVMEIMPDDLLPVVSLTGKEIAPSREGLELREPISSGVGDTAFTIIINAPAEAFGMTESHVKKPYEELRDQGLVAKASRSSQCMIPKPHPLTVTKTFDTFRLIAVESGKDSHKKKKNWIQALVVAAPDCEAQYLICLLQSRLRIGSAGQTLLTGLGQAAVCNNDPHPRPNIQSPSDLDKAAKIVKQVYFMHYMEDDSVEKYSRDTKHNTQMFPDVVLAVLRLKKPSLRSFALDCEVVACEREKQQIFHFQKPLSYPMPIDAFHGDKKRTGVYGAFLLACYDSNNEEFQSSCEVGIGFSEAMLKPQRMFVRSPFKPTVTINPAAIGIVAPDNAISLRFHRLIRVQKDKESRAGSVIYGPITS